MRDLDSQSSGVYIRGQRRRNQRALLVVFAPWCGHCRRFEAQLARYGADIPVFGLNGDAEDASALGVQGFPTLFIVEKNGRLTRYNGDRDLQHIRYHLMA